MLPALIVTVREGAEAALVDLERGETGTIQRISLPAAEQQFLMRIGFVPGVQVRFSRRAPLGDPSVYSVDGTEIALRAETARHIMVQRDLVHLVQRDLVQRDVVQRGGVAAAGDLP
jgi:ferrous iron transport protein A